MEELTDLVAQFKLDDPEAELTREVFARFGRAMYLANCVERGIAATLLQVEWIANLKPPMTRAQYEAECEHFEKECARLPMGPLVKRLLAQPDIPDTLRTLLQQSLDRRNHLAHHYFWERAGEFTVVPNGQLRMIAECDEATALFEATDAAVEAYLGPYRKRHGLTDDVLREARAQVIQEARERLRK